MVDGWYTLRALAGEWDRLLAGTTLEDVYSATRDELTLVFAGDGEAHAVRLSVQPGHRYAFRQPGGSRPRRNVTTLFEAAVGRSLHSVRVAERDRVLDFDLEGDLVVRTLLFGPRANVVLGRAGVVKASFRESVASAGDPVPGPSPAPVVEGAAAIRARWPGESQDVVRAVARALPLVGPLLAVEIVSRAGLEGTDACLVEADGFERLAEAVGSVRGALDEPEPVLYRDGRTPVAFSLIPLAVPPASEVERFDSVDEAVRAFVRASLSHAAFRSEFEPLKRMLEAAVVRNRTRRDRMLREMSGESRADRYEQFGHLLMAARPETHGVDAVEIDDLFGGTGTVRVPLDPALSAVENAERYYAKARQTRRAREEADLRLGQVEGALAEAEGLLAELAGIDDRKVLRAFRKKHTQAMATFARERSADAPAVPFRRFDLGNGYEAWVGRSAKENDALTFRHARKHDRWLHARGVAGSHVVLRCPRRAEAPPPRVVDRAAAIAAWFSKASGSDLVPVIVAERRFVRKPRGAAPGAVVVEREQVVIVEPALPA